MTLQRLENGCGGGEDVKSNKSMQSDRTTRNRSTVEGCSTPFGNVTGIGCSYVVRDDGEGRVEVVE